MEKVHSKDGTTIVRRLCRQMGSWGRTGVDAEAARSWAAG